MVNSQVFTMFAASIPMRSPKFCKYLAFQPRLCLLHHVTSPFSQWYPSGTPDLPTFWAAPSRTAWVWSRRRLRWSPGWTARQRWPGRGWWLRSAAGRMGRGVGASKKNGKMEDFRKRSGRVHKKNWGIAMELVDIIMVWIKMSGEQ